MMSHDDMKQALARLWWSLKITLKTQETHTSWKGNIAKRMYYWEH